MNRTFAALMSAFAMATFATATVEAQTPSCPPEVSKAKAMLSQQAKGQEVQAPRSLAGARQIQAPRGQEVQAPRGQEVQAPRSQAGSKVTGSKAWTLVQEAEMACKKGDMSTAKAKAEAAMAEMK
ncbi:MAG TPA: hypothetical protein VFQ62_01970 [Methylomirabilota bacterium]|nr:hypothetical protein [Methylomirabilota bacterium]